MVFKTTAFDRSAIPPLGASIAFKTVSFFHLLTLEHSMRDRASIIAFDWWSAFLFLYGTLSNSSTYPILALKAVLLHQMRFGLF